MPITVQAGLRVRKLALHSNRSYCYAYRSRAAVTNTNPAPAPVILVRNAGYSLFYIANPGCTGKKYSLSLVWYDTASQIKS
jgi:hypothetical protein